MSGALDGIRVIDFGQYIAGPMAAMLFADAGAEVIRVDPPGGPRWRSPANAVLQRGKQSIVLDLKDDAAQTTARQLIGSADVVIENFRPGVMERLGLGAPTMLAANPRLVYCSIPGFSADDPRAGVAGWEGVVAAAAGLYLPSPRRPDGGPVYWAVPLASSFAAIIAAHATVAALIARERSGEGQRVEVSMFDAAHQVIGHQGELQPGGDRPRDNSASTAANGIRYECADGRWLMFSPPFRGWRWFAERFLPPEWEAEGFFDSSTVRADPALNAELKKRLTLFFKSRPAIEWERAINEESGAAIGTCQTSAEWLADEHARASGCVVAIEDPELGPTWQQGYPIAMTETPLQHQGPRHRLDADRAAVLAAAAARPSSIPGAAQESLSSALQGFRVIDTTQVLAGPTAGRILAEYGAEVIKINNPAADISNHLYVNSGKRTALIDLKAPEALDVIYGLVEKADVFHQNFALGVAERLGIGEAELRSRKPDIVYSSVSCHAYQGWRGRYRGHEQLGQAVTGIMCRLGGSGEPARTRWSICDYGTGNLSALAILLGLFHRLRTGTGQHVQASLSRTGSFLQTPLMVGYEGKVWDEPSGQEAKGWGPLYRLYEARDRWLFLAAQAEGDRARLAAVMDLAGAATMSAAELEAALSAAFQTAMAAEWVERLTAAGIAAQVNMTVEENMETEHLRRRGLSVRREHPGVGAVRTIGPAARLSKTPVRLAFGAPPAGADTRAVLSAAGHGAEADELLIRGAVAEALVRPEAATA